MKKLKIILIFAAFFIILTIAAGCSSAKKMDINSLEEGKQQSSGGGGGGGGGSSYNSSIQFPSIPLRSTPVPAPALSKKTTNSKVLGRYTTGIIDRTRSRVNNIRIAASEINGCVLQPGEVFSFNSVVGDRGSDDGYRKAKVIVNGKARLGTGGGVCQVSSTLYNAASRSGMEIVERHEHSKDVHYVPMGMDATVVYGSLDLKFKNTKSYPVKINMSVRRNRVYASISKTI